MYTQEEINEVLSRNYISATVVHISEKSIGIEFTGTLRFYHLDKLHEIFGTEQLNITKTEKFNVQDPSVSYEETVTTIYIRNYKLTGIFGI